MREHPDAVVEKVLAGLRNADPSPGMKRRILDRLDAHSAASTSRRFHPIWWMRSLPTAQISFAGAIALACLLVIGAVMHRPVKAPVRNAANLPAEIVPPGWAEPEKTAFAHLPAAPDRLKVASAVQPVAVISHAAPSTGPEEVASFPAPPMPMTEQERLLLRMAHRHDVQSTAILRPEIQAKQEAVEVAQFEDFFKEQKIEVKNESE